MLPSPEQHSRRIAREEVSRLHEKSIEQKQTAQEQSRPKSSGKTARKEQPAFDINPKIANEYLARIEAGKEGKAVIKERPLYVAEESQDAVLFQNPSEVYTPWKDVPLVEEKKELPEDRPATWADAARKKSNLPNGASGNPSNPKGA